MTDLLMQYAMELVSQGYKVSFVSIEKPSGEFYKKLKELKL